MKVVVLIYQGKSGKFFANIEIHNKIFDFGFTTIKTKEFASKGVCINKAQEFCLKDLGTECSKVVDETKPSDNKLDKKGGKKIGKK